MLILSRATLIVASLTVACSTWAYTCDELRSGRENGKEIHSYLSVLEAEIENGNVCAKNVLGILYAKGTRIPKDAERAYAIFYNLADQAYPPAMLNMALMVATDKSKYEPAIPNYLLGIFARYFGDKEWGSVAVAARDLGREYLGSAFSNEDLQSTRNEFEVAVKRITYETATGLLRDEADVKERYANIAAMLTLGMAASRLASSGMFGQSPRFYNQPMQFQSPRLYSVYPVGGNYLWVVPH